MIIIITIFGFSRESPDDAVQEWVKDEGKVNDEDILLFLTFGKLFLSVCFDAR